MQANRGMDRKKRLTFHTLGLGAITDPRDAGKRGTGAPRRRPTPPPRIQSLVATTPATSAGRFVGVRRRRLPPAFFVGRAATTRRTNRRLPSERLSADIRYRNRAQPTRILRTVRRRSSERGRDWNTRANRLRDRRRRANGFQSGRDRQIRVSLALDRLEPFTCSSEYPVELREFDT